MKDWKRQCKYGMKVFQDRQLNRLGRDSSSSVEALMLRLDFSLNIGRNSKLELRLPIPLNICVSLKTEKRFLVGLQHSSQYHACNE
jgi:hypothetical protein